jgi:uncharacterized protein (TIGR02284 family)
VDVQEKVVPVLNELIAVCKDEEKNFQTVAEKADNSMLKTLCIQYARERAEFARELQDEVRQLGGRPEYSGTLSNQVRLGWINLKSTVKSNSEETIIAECERGEELAEKAYQEAVNAYLPANITGVIQHHYSLIREAHEQFKSMQQTVS